LILVSGVRETACEQLVDKGLRVRRMFAVVIIFVTLAAAACSGGATNKATGPAQYNDDPKVLSIVMGSEQHLVFQQIVKPWCEQNGLTCNAQELGP
jgi:Ca-activated chloride channel family protein